MPDIRDVICKYADAATFCLLLIYKNNLGQQDILFHYDEAC